MVPNLDADKLDGEEGAAYHDASNLNAGTVPDARFPATLPAASGANLTALNATQLTTGTVPDGRFPATLPAASGANLTALNASNLASGTVPNGRFPATLPAASGANLTALNAANLASGTIPAGRFPTYTAVAYNAANFGASGGGTWTVDSGDQATYRYVVAGKTMHLSVTLDSTSIKTRRGSGPEGAGRHGGAGSHAQMTGDSAGGVRSADGCGAT
jgi:hypothetical protein